MKTRAVINYTDCCIPEGHLSSDEYVKLLSDSFLKDIGITGEELAGILKNPIGIHKIYVEDRQKEAEIYCTMLEKYFSKTNTSPDKIDYLIYTRGDSVASGNPWSMIDEKCINIPYFLQDEFEMSKAQVFNVEQMCAGTIVGAKIASSLIGDGTALKVLLLSSNFFQYPENRLMGGLGLVSDAAGLMEITASNSGLVLTDFAGTTNGSITMVQDFKRGTTPTTVVNVGSGLIKSLVAKNNLTLNDIALIIPQNISKSGWNFYCQSLDFPKEKVFLDNFDDGGHMGDVDIIRNITEVAKRKLLKPQEFAVIYGIGTGTSWNAILVQSV